MLRDVLLVLDPASQKPPLQRIAHLEQRKLAARGAAIDRQDVGFRRYRHASESFIPEIDLCTLGEFACQLSPAHASGQNCSRR